jgi:hypothetical protein
MGNLIRHTITNFFKVFVLFVLTVGIPSCDRCEGVTPYFDIQNITANNFSIANGSGNILNNNDIVAFEDYRIKCSYTVSYFTYAPPLLSLTRAYACAEPGEYGSVEGLDSIFVITNTAYNSFAANDTISSIARVGYVDSDFESLKIFIEKNRNPLFGKEGFMIALTEKPQNLSQAYLFTVVVKLGNGEEYITTTPKVYFR